MTPQTLSIPDYDLMEKLGEGGMGAVYKARSQQTGELVAIKVVSTDKANDPLLLMRFEREGRVARRLDHPNIVKVLDFGSVDRTHFMVMELVDGINLGKRITRQGRLGETEAIEIIRQVAGALSYAHQAGLVHRDVKPENILLAQRGLVKVTDLGLVKVLDSPIDLTLPNCGLGTPNYIAPEQFSNAKHAEPTCDIYSLGATFYTMVTGQIPFRAATPLNVLKKKQRGELASPASLVPGLSDRIERTIMRAMCYDPARRHSTCHEFMAELTGKSTRSVWIKPVVDAEKAEAIADAKTEPLAPPTPQPDPELISEKRAFERYESKQKARCLPLTPFKEDEWKARVFDVSRSGLSITVNRRFEVGTVLLVALPGRSDHDGPKRLVVKVVRHQTQTPRTWLLGCVFPQLISEEELQALL
jgi:serine/threonine protein kinase